MNIGIVGSRRRNSRHDRLKVFELVNKLSSQDVVVSGGCRGIDTWAEEAAKERGLQTIIHRPKLNGLTTYWEIVKAYHSRNSLIARDLDILFAFVAPDRKGGTEDTIRKFEDYQGKRAVLL